MKHPLDRDALTAIVTILIAFACGLVLGPLAVRAIIAVTG